MADKLVFSVGVGVFVKNGNTILVGKRGPLCRRGQGCWALPGGMIETYETIIGGTLREVQEETGLEVQMSGTYPPPGADLNKYLTPPFCIPGLLAVTDHSDINQQQDGRLVQRLSFWIMTVYTGGWPKVMELGKCDGWEWKTLKELSRLEGAENPTHPQYYWTPIPLWRKILRPHFGEF